MSYDNLTEKAKRVKLSVKSCFLFARRMDSVSVGSHTDIAIKLTFRNILDVIFVEVLVVSCDLTWPPTSLSESTESIWLLLWHQWSKDSVIILIIPAAAEKKEG